MKNLLNINHLWLVALGLLFSLNCVADELVAKVDRTTLGADETLTLTVRYEGARASGEPDFSGLNQHFEILSNHQSIQHSIINGRSTSYTEWTLLLFPKNTGQLLIPPFAYNGKSSNPITVKVTEPSVSQQGAGQDVFIETSVDKSEVFVQEQLILTYKLFFNRRIDAFEKPDLALENTRIEELPRVDYQRSLNGTTYGVAEFRFALFPDASGEIEIPKGLWSIRTTDAPGGRFGINSGRFKIHRLKTDAITIHVKQKPDSFPANKIWLPAKDLKISERWSRSTSDFKVGEPITRTLTVVASGLSSEQLPPIVSNGGETSDFKFYPDQPQMENKTDNSGITGTRTESLAVVPTQSGELVLPAVDVQWWNTETQSLELATLPAKTVYVQPGEANTSQSNVIGSPSISQPQVKVEKEIIEVVKTPWYWPVLLAVSSLLALIMSALWWQARSAVNPQSQEPDSEFHKARQLSRQQALAAIKKACQNQSSSDLRKALLQWAQARWPDKAGVTLKHIGEAGIGESLKQELHKLDAQLYASSAEPVDFDLVLKQVQALNNAVQKEPNELLQTLYR